MTGTAEDIIEDVINEVPNSVFVAKRFFSLKAVRAVSRGSERRIRRFRNLVNLTAMLGWTSQMTNPKYRLKYGRYLFYHEPSMFDQIIRNAARRGTTFKEIFHEIMSAVSQAVAHTYFIDRELSKTTHAIYHSRRIPHQWKMTLIANGYEPVKPKAEPFYLNITLPDGQIMGLRR